MTGTGVDMSAVPNASQPDPSQSAIIASTRDLVKTYGKGDAEVHALAGVSVDLERGKLTAIMGPSGSGKSTLMHCMAGLDSPTSGLIVIDGVELGGLNDKALTRLRRDRLGFVFQAYNLVPTLTAAENITLPLDIAGRDVDKEWFDHVIDAVGLRDRLNHRPNQLSGGQQQRVACARALVSRPAIVFGDEPTGNLDSRSSIEVLDLPAEVGRRLRPVDCDRHPRPQLRGVRRSRAVPRGRPDRRRDGPPDGRHGPRADEALRRSGSVSSTC